MGSKVKVLGGELELVGVPNANAPAQPAGTLELMCTNGSNLGYSLTVQGFQTTAPTVARADFASTKPGPISATINAPGRGGSLFPLIPKKVRPVPVSVGEWHALAAGQCDLIARTDVSGLSKLPVMYSVPESVTVK